MLWNEAFGSSLSFSDCYLAVDVVFLYAPITLLVILYSVIVIKLKTQKIPGEQSNNAEQQHRERNGKGMRMAIAIVLGFVLCWVPFGIMNVLSDSEPDLPECGVWFDDTIPYLMAHSNCAINPCICLIFSQKYRQRSLRFLRCFNKVQDGVY